MESIEKLRKYSFNGTVKLDLKTLQYKQTVDDLMSIADEIEHEISERYMLLPVDANGVPIHVGDEVMYGVGQALHYVFAVSEDAAWLNNSANPPIVNLQEFTASQCRHVKPRTIEDVLEEFVNDPLWELEGSYEGIKKQVIEKYAAELQMKGDKDGN